MSEDLLHPSRRCACPSCVADYEHYDTAARLEITVSPGQLPQSLSLLHSTALESHVTLDADPSGHVVFVAPAYRWSSGQELLWSVMAWLSGQGDLPSIADIRAGLDADNFAAVADVLQAEGALR